MDFQTSVRTCFQKYVTFSGRAIRSEYWWFSLFLILASIVLGVVDSVLFGWESMFSPLGDLFSLATILPSLAVTSRRLHDIDKSAWWMLLILREVFVGTLATIYSVGNDDEQTIRSRMAAEVHPLLGTPRFNFASGVSLLLFYAFAMQCMSTLAVVRKETNSWVWPMGQLIFMTTLAYVVALITYQMLQ